MTYYMEFWFFAVACWISTKHVSCEQYRGRYTRDVKDYDIVVPKKVKEDGSFVSYHLPHHYNVARVKRGADSGKVHYVVPIRGEDKILELLPTEDFYGPGMVFEHHARDVKSNINSIRVRKPLPRRCYYHGWIQEEPSSSAAIATCSGLAGSISIGGEQFLIEPIDDEGKPTVDVKHKHLLYKRSYKKLFTNHTCSNNEDAATAFKNRMEWEEKFGKETEDSMKEPWDYDETFPKQGVSKEPAKVGLERRKRFCTTCSPKLLGHCLTPHAPCLIDRPLYIEVLLVVSPRVVQEANIRSDIEQFINTIINMAVRYFQDASLGRPILVKLVRIITLDFLYEDLDPKSTNPQQVLRRFCEWQMHFNPRMEDHPNHHDYAVYLVKMDPCEGMVLGLANMASLCRPDRSCAIVNEEGLLSGHILTHMLGHSLGAEHDDSSTASCASQEPDGTTYHMATHITGTSTAWSACSKQRIIQFVKTHAGWCLGDMPSAADLTEPVVLPGQVYSAAQQCRINFEIDTYACIVGHFCKRLYCKINDQECISMGDPPAQGTTCGPNMWCFNGECVHRGTRPGAINGEWGEWTSWSHCTKTCGGGIQSTHRACDSPSPSRGGKLCPGPWIKSRMCNIGKCPDAGKGFLDVQCKLTNERLYKGKHHEWVYFNQQIEDLQCVVICVNEQNDVAVRAPLARDGTYCKPGYKDVCIRGACKPVGCDWVIGSNAKEDACGICHGNGTECRIMQGFFGDRNVRGVVEFLKLPIGTSMVLIRETIPAPCFFMIRNSLNASYYLNTESSDQLFFTGTFRIGGVTGVYQLKGDMERIFIKEPILIPITISTVCIFTELAVGILYQYALPEPHTQSSIPTYTWEFLSWEKCPFPCGGGAQRAIPVCVEAQGGEVEDCYCSELARPPDKVRVCNSRPCVARWWVGPWASCECYHQEGVTTRMVMCAQLKEPRSAFIDIVPEDECTGVPKPRVEKACDPVKEQEYWAKKNNPKKRDLTDIVPYSDLAEEYTVWDDVAEDKYPVMVNVRNMLQRMDPENVQDYAYLQRIGMSSQIWDKINTDTTYPRQRVRVKRHKGTKKQRVRAPHSKPKEVSTKPPNLKKEQPKASRINAKALKKRPPTPATSAETETPIHTKSVDQQENDELDDLQTVTRSSIAAEATGRKKTSAFHTTTHRTTEEDRTTDEEGEDITQRVIEKTDSASIKPKVTTSRTMVTLRGRKKKLGRKMTPIASVKVSRYLKHGKCCDDHTMAMTAPVVTDPGLDYITFYATETPFPQQTCAGAEVKPLDREAPCIEDGPPEPAEAGAEIDFLNTSAIKIYVVPIQTTVRTIIQSDQEFIMMETLAKFPIGDEMKVVEHWGDNAKRELKIARDRMKAQTKSPMIQD